MMMTSSETNDGRIGLTSLAIYTDKTRKGERLKYYSNLLVDLSPKFKWKVYIGDLVAISTTEDGNYRDEDITTTTTATNKDGNKKHKNDLTNQTKPVKLGIQSNDPQQQRLEYLEQWSANHYERPSPHWRVGLVVALCNRVSTSTRGHYECHVQWLDKCLDCTDDEIGPLRTSFRSYGAQKGNRGAQLPHILINRLGDYGIVSPLQVLPVKIHMMNKQEFNAKGVLTATEESQFYLKFCCLKTRCHVSSTTVPVPAATIADPDRPTNDEGTVRKTVIVADMASDEWTKLNPPTIDDDDVNESVVNSKTNSFLPVPVPLNQAWKGWLESATIVSSAVSSSSTTDLQNALMMGWSQSRRDRARKAARSVVAAAMKTATTTTPTAYQPIPVGTTSVSKKGSTSGNGNCIQKSIVDRNLSSIMRDKSRMNHDDGTTMIATKKFKTDKVDTKTKGRKKEIRFSVDTKEADTEHNALSFTASITKSSKRNSNILAPVRTNTTDKQPIGKTNPKKRSRPSIPATEEVAIMTITNVPKKTTRIEQSNKRPASGRNQYLTPSSRDENASSTTLESHSSDTTLQTRGAGRKRKHSRSVPSIGSNNDDGDNTEETSTLNNSSLPGCSSVTSDVSALMEEWKIEPIHNEPFYSTKSREYYAAIRMTIPSRCCLGLLLVEPSSETIPNGPNDQNCRKESNMHFTVGIGSVVAIHCDEATSGTGSWSPFRVPWGFAQIVSIYKSLDRISESDHDDNVESDDEDYGSWSISIKWFYRYSELNKSRKGMVANTIDEIYGLVETFEVATSSSAKAILPGYIRLTSDREVFQRRNTDESWEDDGLPVVRMLCQHLQSTTITALTDWNYSYSPLSSNLQWTVPPPMQRVLKRMGNTLKSKYLEWLSAAKVSGGDTGSCVTPALPVSTNDIVPQTPTSSVVLCELWGNKFYDLLHINVDERNLMPPFRSKSKTFRLAVGNVVAIALKQGHLNNRGSKRPDGWFPFSRPWSPAQVVSLYQTEPGEWMAQIRWFERFHDIQPQHQAVLKGLDKPFIIFETEVFEIVPVATVLPGRIVPTSVETLHDWDVKASENSGLPLIPRLCTHICLDDEIDNSRDWTNYDINLSRIPGPLSRGLRLSPRNRQNKEWISSLTRYYEKAIKRRDTDPEYRAVESWYSNTENLSQNMESTSFNADDVIVSTRSHLLTTKVDNRTLEFHKVFSVSAPVKYVVNPTNVMKRTKKNSFICTVGDIVTYYDPLSLRATQQCISLPPINRPWFPFVVPWTYGQVLSIYKESTDGETGNVKVEIRRFFRLSEIPAHTEVLFPSKESNLEEVFESDDIRGVPASHVLGVARVFLGSQETSYDKENMGNVAYMTSCRCRFFYLSSHQKLQPIYSSSLLPAGWRLDMEERGYHLSEFLRRHPALLEAYRTENKQPNMGNFKELLSPIKHEVSEGSCARVGTSIRSLIASRSFLADISLHPQWTQFIGSESLYRFRKRESKLWLLQVGDIVAVKTNNGSAGDDGEYPFRVPWGPCQLLAICDRSATTNGENLEFTVRFLNVESSANDNNPSTLTSTSAEETRTIASTDLLGPIIVQSKGMDSKLDLSSIQTHLPLCPLHVAESFSIDLETSLTLSKIYTSDEIVQIMRLLKRTNMPIRINDDDMKFFPASSAGLSDRSSIGQPGDVWSEREPFHIDSSGRRAFYSEICLIPKFKSNRDNGLRASQMTVRTGDTILVRFDGPKRFPMDCNWGVAEVLVIFRDFGSREELEKCPKLTTLGHHDRYQIEIRWFYERNDIAMATNNFELDDCELVEVFETDHVQTFEAGTTIVAAANLVEDVSSKVPANDTTTLAFVCKRFWSTQRRSLIPCSGLSGRKRRGMMYSKYLVPEGCGTPSSNRISAKHLTELTPGWKECMANVIGKLTLKDASQHAYGKGAALVGREGEIERLVTFFRSALRGDPGKGGVKSSIFLAGPPGVGKTACVRTAVAQLQHEHSNGLLPKFRFIGLNGMELRHPFEAYVRLWEALTGRKHVGSYEKACEWLGAYFTSPLEGPEQVDNVATVLLVDEIDYLVTDKQTVLYDFFNWPKQAAGTTGGKRLIVVGISNTLNLAEQLMPSVRSRLDAEKCVFKAYSLQDTISILNSKLTEASPHFSFFEEDAILFAAKKTAALSGDIRRAFQICRTAAELVTQRFESEQGANERQPHPKIRIGDVQKASQESFNMALVAAVSFSTSFEALLLIALAALRRTTGREVGGFDVQDILVKMEAIASAAGDPEYSPPPAFGETLELINRLGEMNLVEVYSNGGTSSRSGGGFGMTSLSVDEHTLVRGLKNTHHKQLAQANLSCF